MTTGWRLREALEEQPPPCEEVVACQVGVGGAEQLGHARLDEVTLLGAGDQLVQALAQLGAHHVVRILLADAEALAHDLGEGPVGDAVAVGEALAAVPEDVQGQAIDVLVELPGQPRLADPGRTHDRHAGARRAVPWRCGRAP